MFSLNGDIKLYSTWKQSKLIILLYRNKIAAVASAGQGMGNGHITASEAHRIASAASSGCIPMRCKC